MEVSRSSFIFFNVLESDLQRELSCYMKNILKYVSIVSIIIDLAEQYKHTQQIYGISVHPDSTVP